MSRKNKEILNGQLMYAVLDISMAECFLEPLNVESSVKTNPSVRSML